MESIQRFLLSTEDSLELDHLPFIHPINCSVTLKRSKEDEGLRNVGKDNKFSCYLSSSGYKQMIEIIKHIGNGHNWLTPGEYYDEPAFLLSRHGPW
jgi:hypothetical protein